MSCPSSDDRSAGKCGPWHIGMVFQHMALLPHRTVRDNVAFPLGDPGRAQVQALGGVAEDVSRWSIWTAMRTGFRARIVRRHAATGRTGARTRVRSSRCCSMDEPFSALDPLIRRQLQDQFMELTKVLSSKRPPCSSPTISTRRSASATRIAIMKDGRNRSDRHAGGHRDAIRRTIMSAISSKASPSSSWSSPTTIMLNRSTATTPPNGVKISARFRVHGTRTAISIMLIDIAITTDASGGRHSDTMTARVSESSPRRRLLQGHPGRQVNA